MRGRPSTGFFEFSKTPAEKLTDKLESLLQEESLPSAEFVSLLYTRESFGAYINLQPQVTAGGYINQGSLFPRSFEIIDEAMSDLNSVSPSLPLNHPAEKYYLEVDTVLQKEKITQEELIKAEANLAEAIIACPDNLFFYQDRKKLKALAEKNKLHACEKLIPNALGMEFSKTYLRYKTHLNPYPSLEKVLEKGDGVEMLFKGVQHLADMDLENALSAFQANVLILGHDPLLYNLFGIARHFQCKNASNRNNFFEGANAFFKKAIQFTNFFHSPYFMALFNLGYHAIEHCDLSRRDELTIAGLNLQIALRSSSSLLYLAPHHRHTLQVFIEEEKERTLMRLSDFLLRALVISNRSELCEKNDRNELFLLCAKMLLAQPEESQAYYFLADIYRIEKLFSLSLYSFKQAEKYLNKQLPCMKQNLKCNLYLKWQDLYHNLSQYAASEATGGLNFYPNAMIGDLLRMLLIRGQTKVTESLLEGKSDFLQPIISNLKKHERASEEASKKKSDRLAKKEEAEKKQRKEIEEKAAARREQQKKDAERKRIEQARLNHLRAQAKEENRQRRLAEEKLRKEQREKEKLEREKAEREEKEKVEREKDEKEKSEKEKAEKEKKAVVEVKQKKTDTTPKLKKPNKRHQRKLAARQSKQPDSKKEVDSSATEKKQEIISPRPAAAVSPAPAIPTAKETPAKLLPEKIEVTSAPVPVTIVELVQTVRASSVSPVSPLQQTSRVKLKKTQSLPQQSLPLSPMPVSTTMSRNLLATLKEDLQEKNSLFKEHDMSVFIPPGVAEMMLRAESAHAQKECPHLRKNDFATMYIFGGWLRDMLINMLQQRSEANQIYPNDIDMKSRWDSKQLEEKGIVVLTPGDQSLSGPARYVLFRNRYKVELATSETFYRDLLDEVENGDFTINSFIGAKIIKKGENYFLQVCDKLNGRGFEDLKNGRIETVKRAEISFKEDVWRILRAINLSSVTQFTLSSDILTVIPNFLSAFLINPQKLNKELAKLLLRPMVAWENYNKLRQMTSQNGQPIEILKTLFPDFMQNITPTDERWMEILCKNLQGSLFVFYGAMIISMALRDPAARQSNEIFIGHCFAIKNGNCFFQSAFADYPVESFLRDMFCYLQFRKQYVECMEFNFPPAGSLTSVGQYQQRTISPETVVHQSKQPQHRR